MPGDVKVTLPDGVFDAVEVPVTETTERWTDVKLDDGSVLRIKPVVLSVARIKGRFDPEGNPLYATKTGCTMMVAVVPDELKQKVH